MKLFNRTFGKNTNTAAAAEDTTELVNDELAVQSESTSGSKMKDVLKFTFEGMDIRVAGTPEKPLFCGKDVAVCLGYDDPKRAVRRHCKGGAVFASPSNGGIQKMKFIPQSDLFRLIMKSNAEHAEEFQDWVCEEVLTSIAKNGGYIDGANPETDLQTQMNQQVLQLIGNLTSVVGELQREFAELRAERRELQPVPQALEHGSSEALGITALETSNYHDMHELVKTLYIHCLKSGNARKEFCFREMVKICWDNRLFLPYINRDSMGAPTAACCSRFGRHLVKYFPGKLWKLEGADLSVSILGTSSRRRYVAVIL